MFRDLVGEQEVLTIVEVEYFTWEVVTIDLVKGEISLFNARQDQFVGGNWLVIVFTGMWGYLLFHIHKGISDLNGQWITIDLVLDSVGQEEIGALNIAWDRHRDTHVRVKGHRDLIADGTLQGWLILSLHQINNDWLISFKMTIPVLFGNHSISTIVRFTLLHIWFFEHPIKIFM